MDQSLLVPKPNCLGGGGKNLVYRLAGAMQGSRRDAGFALDLRRAAY
jgi:hypothetical protein